jgi:hypothetical protein
MIRVYLFQHVLKKVDVSLLSPKNLKFVVASALLASTVGCADAQEPKPVTSVAIDYTLDKPGQVSLAVYNREGVLLRSLLHGEEQKAGRHQVKWDGLDRYGKAVTPGAYSWKLLRTPGFEAKYLTTIGTNPSTAPYDSWIGNFDAPQSLLVDGEVLYAASGISENVPVIIKQSLDGKKRMWTQMWYEAWMGGYSLALANDRLLMLQNNGRLVSINPKNGERRTFLETGWPGGDEKQQQRGAPKLMRMDAQGDRVVLTHKEQNAVRWLNAADGKMTAEMSVPQPFAVALAADGRTLVASGDQILELSADAKTSRIFIAAGQLSNPISLSLNRQNGELLVAEGAPSHQIKLFDRAGKLLKTYGRNGGRAYGRFVASDFLNITSVATAANGDWFVAEGGKTLRRLSRFNRKGEVLNQWFGPQTFFNFSCPDPAAPDEVYFMGGGAEKTVGKADYARGTWDVIAAYHHHDFEGLFPLADHYAVQWLVRARRGETFLVTDGNNAGPAILRVDKQKGVLLPVAVSGRADVKNPNRYWLAAIKQAGFSDVSKAPTTFSWSDVNGNGQIEPSEFVLGGDYRSRPGYLDENWNYSVATGTRNTDEAAWEVLPNLAAPNAAVPIWDWNKVQPSAARFPDEIRAMGMLEVRGFYRDAQRNAYMMLAGNRGPGDDRHGEEWPTHRIGSARFLKWDAAGKLQWSVGQHAIRDPHNRKNPPPGWQYHDPVRLLGTVSDTIVTGDRVVHPASAWTKDGLFAGTFLDRRAADGLPPYLYAWWRDAETMNPDTPIPYDLLTGGSVTPQSQNSALWMPQGEQNSPAYRVTGWENWERKQGTINITTAPSTATRGGTGLNAEYFDNTELQGPAKISRVDGRVWFEQKKAGNVYGAWKGGPAPGIDTAFSARWTGFVEPHLSEPFTFSVYGESNARVRLWLGDKLIIDGWTPRSQRKALALTSEPISLQAGNKSSIRLEYASGSVEPNLSLNWESFTQERQRIPTALLYPQE